MKSKVASRDKDIIKIPSEVLSADEIRERIKNHEQIQNPSDLRYGDRIQYFEILQNNEYKYKIGGTLIINKSPDYIVLTNGKKNWSVQLKQHIIFREISVDKLREHYERLLGDKNRTIEELKYLIQEYKKKSK